MKHEPSDDRESMRFPAPPVPDDEAGDLHRQCDEGRETLTPRDTADCAGLDLVEAFENEEDGGS